MAMATVALAESNYRLPKKPNHRHNDSGELDVFEAARYFSGGAEAAPFVGGAAIHKANKEERPVLGGETKSSVTHMQEQDPLPSRSQALGKSIKEKKSKQPNSPGSKLASFLNSLFSQTSSKKKSKSKNQSTKDDEESPGGRRKRRSSISHFQSISSKTDAKSVYSSQNTGFRTPPPYSHTPTKVYKDPISYSDPKKVGSFSLPRKNGSLAEKQNICSVSLDDTFKFSDGFIEKSKNFDSALLDKERLFCKGFLEKDRTWVDKFSLEENFSRDEEMEDGCESDSSSDLFELQNYDLGLYSNGLPVYETTNMDRIQRGVPIANASF